MLHPHGACSSAVAIEAMVRRTSASGSGGTKAMSRPELGEVAGDDGRQPAEEQAGDARQGVVALALGDRPRHQIRAHSLAGRPPVVV